MLYWIVHWPECININGFVINTLFHTVFAHDKFIKYEDFNKDCPTITGCVECYQADFINASGQDKAVI